MKRISTLCAVLISGMAFAQVSGNLQNAKHAKNYLENGSTPGHAVMSNRAVFYTNDFSTPSDWTMTNASSPSYDWEIVNALPSGLTGQNFGPTFNSTSGGNFALVNSDGEGSTATQDCNMTNAVAINCSAQPTVAISFMNYHRIFQETHVIGVSADGVNFTDFAVNTNYGSLNGNYVTSPNAEQVMLNISCVAASQSTVYVRFNYKGAYDWFWCVDDVELSDAPGYDTRLSAPALYNVTYNVNAGQPIDYYIAPAAQVDDLVFKGTLSNLGASDALASQIDAVVKNSASSTVFTGSSTSATIFSCDSSRVDTLVWTGTSTTTDAYSIIMTSDYTDISSDGTPDNNVDTLVYTVTPNSGTGSQYARDNNVFTTNGMWNGAGNGYIMGNTFDVYTNATLYSIDVSLDASTDPGVIGCVILYEIDPSTGDFNPLIDNCLDGYEYPIQANQISTGTIERWVSFPVNGAAPLTGYPLTAGTQYIAAISHYGGADEMVIQQGGSAPGGWTVWLFDQTDATWYYMTTKPKVRMGFDNGVSFLGAEETEIVNLGLSQNMPNPANGNTSIGYSLKQNSDVVFTIVDVTGKVVYNENMGNKAAGTYSLNLDVNQFANGVYYYTMTAGAEKITKKMVISE